jgi:addiction module HigA family antidote
LDQQRKPKGVGGEKPNRFRGLDFGAAVDVLLALNVARAPTDLGALNSLGLHRLKGSRRGQWAISVNARWRIQRRDRRLPQRMNSMPPISHPGRLLKRELTARALSANRLALAIGVPSGRITDILNGRRSISADTAVRLGRYFGNRPQFWMDLQGQYDIAVVERDRGREIARRVQTAPAA